MKALVFALLLGAAPVFAGGVDSDVGRGLSLMDRGARLLLRGMIAGVEPRLRQLVDEMGPVLRDMRGALGDLNAYHAPEIQPNGDIIIRRKVPLVPLAPGAGGETEL